MTRYNLGALAFHLLVIVIGFPVAVGFSAYDAAKRGFRCNRSEGS